MSAKKFTGQSHDYFAEAEIPDFAMTQETTRATGKWCQPGVPHKGWTFVGFGDLGEPSAICEMCETQEIRYVHYMEHPHYPTGR